MKKLFNHTKRPDEGWKGYDENDYDWDEPEYEAYPGQEEYGQGGSLYIEEEDEGDYYREPQYLEEEPEGMEAEYYGEPEYFEEEPEGTEAEYYGEPEYFEEEPESMTTEYYGEPEYFEEEPEAIEAEYYGEPEYFEEEPEAIEAEYYGEPEYFEEEPEVIEAEYYGEQEYFEEEPEGTEAEYYGEPGCNGETAYYGETDYVMEEPLEEGRLSRKQKENQGSTKGFFYKLQRGITAMGAMDKVILVTGVAVLIMALVTGGIYISSRIVDGQVAAFASVGSQLEGIDTIGGQGLLAVADAELARIAAMEAVQDQVVEPPKEYQEAEYERDITVTLSLTSVQKDLKIKFVNQSNGKLISNVPFAVTVTGPDGKSAVWSDDDMDGIIYKKDITPGSYTVVMEPFTDQQYSNYNISETSQKVEVKKDIDYKKVDVSNEIKKESEVNAAKEDTKQNITEVESTLADTVEWVESKVIASTYNEVPKSSIPDPVTLVAAGSLGTLNRVAEAGSTVPDPGTAVPTPDPGTAVPTPDPGTAVPTPDPGAATPTPDPGTAVPTPDPGTATPTPDPGIVTPTPDPGIATPTPDPVPTTPAPPIPTTPVPVLTGIALDKSEVSILASNTATVNATLTGAVATDAVVSAASADGNVAAVSVAGTVVTVTGVNAGSTAVTVSYTENGQTVAADFTVTVKGHPKDDNSTKLRDTEGRQLYVLVDSAYREAVYADYYTTDKFFIVGDPKYTGWQTLDGNLYYFTPGGEKVTGEQVIQGARYNFASDGSLVKGSGNMGIDVSKWNGNIDWAAVSNSGVSYVIIRCGYRGSSQGSLIEDPKFAANIKGATAAGLKVGVYFFTQAVDEVEAVEEASMVLDQIRGYKISYPVFLDVEPSGGRADSIDRATRTAVCKAFCETIQDSGYTAGVYANKTWLTNKLNVNELGAYKIWLAQYVASPTYNGRYDLWQYKASGSVSGIKGNVDMNLSYLGY